MKLYYSPGACSLSPHIALCEAGLPFELERVDFKTKQTKSGADFNQINPKSSVPALRLDNGEILTEGPAIVQYIADLRPESGLAPAAGSMARYRLQEWLNFISTELHKSFSPLFSPTASADWKEAATKNLHKRFDFVVAHLATHPYLLGDTFTVADGYLFTVFNWTRFVGMDTSAWPALQQYVERIAARPKVHEAMKAEGLLKEAK